MHQQITTFAELVFAATCLAAAAMLWFWPGEE